MATAIGQQLRAQLAVVGQLPVVAQAEPLPLFEIVPLQRLGVVAIFLAAGGVTHVPNRRRACKLLHQPFVFGSMAHPKHVADAAQIFVRLQQLPPLRDDTSSCPPKAARAFGYPTASAAAAGKFPQVLRPGTARWAQPPLRR